MTSWVEKYRPVHLNEVIGQEHITDRLTAMVKQVHDSNTDGDFPHMIFVGQAGVGKTAAAIALMRDLWGESWEANFLELNASDTRSINDIRGQVKKFATKGTIGTYRNKNDEIVRIPFNTVFLDEADHLTPDAQAALRRMMEKYSHLTRFILCCNYPQRIIEPIRDRCAFADTRFKPVSKTHLMSILDRIVTDEELKIETEALGKIIEASKGSVRKATGVLYTATRGGKTVTVKSLETLLPTVGDGFNLRLLQLAVEANDTKDDDIYERNMAILDKHLEELYYDKGFGAGEILDSLYNTVEGDANMPVSLKRKFYRQIAQHLYWCSVSSNPLLQMKTFFRWVTSE